LLDRADMNATLSRPSRALAAIASLGAASALFLVSAPASAQQVVVRERVAGEPSAYLLEIEPHFTFGAENVYGNTGYGAGLRAGVPFVPSLLTNVPDNLAFSLGADFLHYENCFFPDRCGANYLDFIGAVQWNIFVLPRLSVFAEGGAFVYAGFFTGCSAADGPDCANPSRTGVLPTLAVGGRLHFADHAALALRLGYPSMTLGLSFL
jgi:hypothetical protein